MTMELIPLYLGKCLSDLTKLYETLPDCRGKKIQMLLKTANSLYKNAEKYRLLADQEQSYVYYMRYLSLIHIIRQNPDYSRDKQFVTQMLGGQTRQDIAIEIVTDLSNSLKLRYDKLNKKLSAIKTSTDNNTIINTSLSKKNHSYNDVMNDEREFRPNTAITCKQLYYMIKKQNPCESLLIMDCRPKEDFRKSRLIYTSCLNVPQEILNLGMSAGKVQLELDDKSRVLWASRSVKDHVVLMDWDCKNADPPTSSAINRLRNILRNWDPDTRYRSPIKILEGGYENLILLYPTICTDSTVINPLKSNESDSELLDDIEYPTILEMTMQDDLVFTNNIPLYPQQQYIQQEQLQQRTIPPNIDRSSKLAAQKIYENKQKIDILREREAIIDKALENEQILLNTETQWKNVQKEVVKSDNIDKKKLLAEHQQLLYKIYQLENNGRDYESENDRLRLELEDFKAREKDYNNKISEIEAENLKLTEKRIEEKSKQQKLIDEQREQEKLERVKQLKNISEQKKHLRPTIEEESSKPKIPQFDRSIKPALQAISNFVEPKIQRDFSPIRGTTGRGLTGLKNLGNTCYMNSIMQCLSNTGTLTDYFVTNNYKTHVNRENKTKGRIAEEVAALVKVLWNGQYKCVASKDLRYVIGQYQQIFSGIEQQDSHEFLTILMDWLHSDLQTLQITDSPRRDNLHAAEKSWLEFTKSCESYILQLFYGQIKSTVKCVECTKESATYECFSNLSLELPPTANRCQIDNCLNMYFHGEIICGWNCPNCKQERKAIKKLSISKLPPILVIHLKRFYADPESPTVTYKKKQNYVHFPLEQLDMTPHIAKSESRSRAPKTYNLYSVSNHYGSMESGHYTAFCKSTVFNRWFKYDDTVVSNLDSSDVVSSAAYILFYTNLPLSKPSDIV